MSSNKRKNPTRSILIGIGLLMLLLIVVAFVLKDSLGGKEKAIEVEVARAEIRDITQVVTASGKIQPEIEVKISPDVSGEIIYLGVKEGDWVEKGQLLIRIKPDFYEAQVEQAAAGVAQAKANLEQAYAQLLKAEADFKRQKQLFEKNVIPESEYLAAQTQYQIAQASYDAARYQVESAEARLKEAKEQLQKTQIYAPISGTVSQLNVELGERVVGTSQMAGTDIMHIARLDQMEAEVEVNENDVVFVNVGDTAAIEVDAYPEQRFKGEVIEIAHSARIQAAGTQEQVTNFPVKIRILDPHNLDKRPASTSPSASLTAHEVTPPSEDAPEFRPGMSTTADIFAQTVFDVVAVPIQAVTIRDFARLKQEEKPEETAEEDSILTFKLPEEDLRKVVFIVEDGKAKMVEVETGISDDTYIQITSGLRGGELVIIGPYKAVSRTLKPDTPVRIKKPRRKDENA